MARRLVSRSELARLAGVSAAAITKACKGSLSASLVGKRVDLDHADVQSYLRSKGKAAGAPTSSAKQAPKGTARPTKTPRAKGAVGQKPPAPRRRKAASDEPVDAPPGPTEVSWEDIEAYAYLSLAELTQMFGTCQAFKDWLDARKKIADIREKDLKNDETEGRLIEREFVKTHVFGAIEATHRRLLGDSPKTIARRLYAMAKGGATVEEAEGVVREIVSSQLKPAKATAVRVLRNA